MSKPIMRKLGRSDIEVSAVGMGCWAIGGPFWAGDKASGWGDIDDNQSIKSIHRSLEMGVNFFDTADVYGTGHSERILAKALEGKRDKAVIATKFGNVFDEKTKQLTGNDASPEYIINACNASLKRLNTDYIDLYQFHLNGFGPDGAEEVVEVLETLVAEGKIRYYGWSTDFPERATVFAKGKHCSSIQCQLNVLDDNAELVELCEKEDLACINRGPLAMGLLTGKYTSNSDFPENDVRGAHSPDWMKYFKKGKMSEAFYHKVEKIRGILTSEGRTLAQGALAWLWARSPLTIPIPGFKNIDQVEQNAGAMHFGPLSEFQMEEIDKLLGR
jgi:aryl-alcohol dehydrogenase-like predicted oxidoreductase